MAANYKIVSKKQNHEVIESQTEQVMLSTKDKKSAIQLNNWLNSGGCFNGWTPAFFLIRA